MFCRNCGFETDDQALTQCPECGCVLSRDNTEDPETEEVFEDIDNILNSEDSESDSEKQPALETEGSPEVKNEPDAPSAEKNQAAAETDEAADNRPEEDAPQTTAKIPPLLFFIFLLIIAAGAGVFYLKSKQPDTPTIPRIKTARQEEKTLKSILKKDGRQPAANKKRRQEPPATVSKTEPPAGPRAVPSPETAQKIQKKPAAPEPTAQTKKPSADQEVAKPVTRKVPAAVKQPVTTKDKPPKTENSIASKKADRPEPSAAIEKTSLKKPFWTVYKPGRKTFFTLQISSMATRAYARSHLDRLRKSGHPAYVILVKNREGQPVYKLRIGKYASESEARKAADAFYQKEKMKSIIVNSNADIDL